MFEIKRYFEVIKIKNESLIITYDFSQEVYYQYRKSKEVETHIGFATFLMLT